MAGLWKSITQRYCPDLYVLLRPGSLRVTNISTGAVYETAAAMLHPSTLFDDPQAFHAVLSVAFDRVLDRGGFLKPSPRVVIHPVEGLEEGLSRVKARSIAEAVLAERATECHIWVGNELSAANFESKEFTGGDWFSLID